MFSCSLLCDQNYPFFTKKKKKKNAQASFENADKVRAAKQDHKSILKENWLLDCVRTKSVQMLDESNTLHIGSDEKQLPVKATRSISTPALSNAAIDAKKAVDNYDGDNDDDDDDEKTEELQM